MLERMCLSSMPAVNQVDPTAAKCRGVRAMFLLEYIAPSVSSFPLLGRSLVAKRRAKRGSGHRNVFCQRPHPPLRWHTARVNSLRTSNSATLNLFFESLLPHFFFFYCAPKKKKEAHTNDNIAAINIYTTQNFNG